MEQKETLKVWAHPAKKALLDLKGTKETGALLVFKDQNECESAVPPKIFISPESQYVFLNKSATFYCWVQGQSFNKKITWRKLEGN